ncbi:PREDICTED: voltage-dependent calcium channel type A subunit alpha-1-like [Acromyrmex echinatior]
MLGGVGGRHVSTRRRGSNPLVRGGVGLIGYGATSGTSGGLGNTDGNATQLDAMPRYAARRRRAVTTSDHKSCALIQTRLKLGDIM